MKEYSDFFSRFGGSLRSKHVVPNNHVFFDMKAWGQRILGRGAYAAATRMANKRIFNLPRFSALPRDYIRLDPWEAEYLFVLAAISKHGIIETGRFHGGSTFLLACANGTVPIHSIDIKPQNDDLLRGYFKQQAVGGNVNLIIGDSQNTRYPEIEHADLLFIDGDHSYEGCTRDLENWFPLLTEGGHVILHDCYFGKASEVQRSVIDFISHHPVEVVRPPYIPANHWHYPAGSLAHLIKR